MPGDWSGSNFSHSELHQNIGKIHATWIFECNHMLCNLTLIVSSCITDHSIFDVVTPDTICCLSFRGGIILQEQVVILWTLDLDVGCNKISMTRL